MLLRLGVFRDVAQSVYRFWNKFLEVPTRSFVEVLGYLPDLAASSCFLQPGGLGNTIGPFLFQRWQRAEHPTGRRLNHTLGKG